MPARITHPTPDRLAAYGSGRLAPEDALVVEEHLGTCDECGARLDGFFPDTFAAILRRAAAIESECSVHAPTVVFASDATATDLDTIPAELAAHPRYRLGELLGRGGMGAVYKAEHTLMERPVAVKVIAPQLLRHPGAAERFKQEVKAAAKLHHPNIVTAHDAEEVGPVTVLVMEYVEGRSLADVLGDRGPLPVAEACGYARQVALGLAHAHALGMVHRDIKPHNLMLAADGCVKILDFGLARFATEGRTESAETISNAPPTEVGLTHTGACMGTLDYMPPEQAQDARTADHRADVYALGSTLYHLLTGRVPFPGGNSLDKLSRLRTEAPTPLAELRPDAPPELAALIGRLMAKRPEERPASATEAADALSAFAHPAAPRRRRKAPFALAALAALLVVGVATAWSVVRIPTEQGEVLIETDDAEIEIVVKGDQIVRIRDPKTGRAYALDRKDLTLSETDGNGLRVILDDTKPIVLRRNGEKIATIRLAAPKPSEFKPFVGHTNLCRGAVFGPDGTLYTCSDDGTARAWDATGREVRRFDHGDVVLAVAVAEGGRTLLTSGEFGLRAWEAASGKPLGRFPAIPKGEKLNGIAVSPDGSRAATVSINGAVRIWNVAGRKAVRDWRAGGGRPVHVVAWSPDGQAVATAGDDRAITLADPETGKAVARFDRVAAPVSSLAFTADGKQLLAGCFAGGVKEIDRATGAVTMLAGPQGEEPFRLAVTSGGRLVVGYGRRVVSWDAVVGGSATEIVLPPGVVSWVAVSPDGRRTAVVGYGGTVTVAALPAVPRPLPASPPLELTELWRTGDQRGPRALAVSPNGKWAYSSGYDSTARQWNLTTRQEVRQYGAGTEPFDSLAVSADGTRLLVAHHKLVVRLWNVDSGKELQTFQGHTGTVACVALSADSRRVLTGAHDNTVRLWDAETGKELKTLKGHTAPVRAVAFLPGNRAVSGAHDSTVRVWDLATGETVKQFAPLEGWVYSMAVLPDGKRIAVNDARDTVILDVESGRITQRFTGHTSFVHAVAVSPDGKLLATGGYDKTIRVWDLNTGRCIAIGRGYADYVVSVAFVGNTRLLSAGDDTIRLWGFSDEVRSPEIAKARLLPFTGETRFPLFHPDGRHLLIPDGNKVTVWDTTTGEKRKQFDGSPERIMCLRLTADRKTLVALACGNRVVGWDWETGRKVDGFAAAPIPVPLALAVFPDGLRVATRDEPGIVSVRSWPDGKTLDRIDLGNKDAVVWSFEVSPDGRWLAIVCTSGQTWVWDATLKKTAATFPAVKDAYRTAACSFDSAGRWLAVGTSKGARVWEVDRWAAAPATLPADAAGMVAFDPTGAVLVTAPIQTSGAAPFSRWGWRTGERFGTVVMMLTQEWVHAALAPDGRTVAVEVTPRKGFVLFDSDARPRPVAPPPRPVTAKPIPAELDLIPRDAAGFITVRVGDLTRIPAQQWIWPKPDQALGAPGSDLDGVRQSNIVRATVVWPTGDHPDADIYAVPPERLSRLLVLTRAEPFTATHPAFVGRGKSWEEYRGRRYALDSDGWTACYPADPHTVVIGSRASVRFLLDHLADPKSGPLDDAVRTAAESPGQIAVGINGRPFTRARLEKLPWELQPPKPFPGVPAFSPASFTLTVGCRNGFELGLVARFDTEETAEEGRRALAEVCAHQGRLFRRLAGAGDEVAGKVAGAVPGGRNSLEANLYAKQVAFYDQAADALLAAKPVRSGTDVRVSLRTDATLAFEELLNGHVGYVYFRYGYALLDSTGAAERHDRAMARALAAYHADHGRFPPPAILGKDGKPLLSWRVAVLPYLGDECAALYKRFRLDEPWDSPANRALIDPMPAALATTFVVPPYRNRPVSGYRVFAVPELKPPAAGAPPPDPSAAVIAVRTDEQVPWSRPDAPIPEELKSVPSAVILADGSARWLPRTDDLKEVRAALVRGGARFPTPKPPPDPPPGQVPGVQPGDEPR